MSKKAAKNYINNKAFYEALVERKKLKESNPEPPQISKYLCECIMHICKRLSYNPNFINYSYREDMVDEAIFTCIMNIDKFETNVISMKTFQDSSELPEGKIIYKFNNDFKIKDKILIGETSEAQVKVKAYNKETRRVIARTLDENILLQDENVYYIDEYNNKQYITLNGITYSNAFAFFTQCAWNSFIFKIKQENNETRIKAAIFQSKCTEFMDIQEHDEGEDFSSGFVEFVKNNIYMDMDLSPKLKKVKEKKENLKINIEDI